MTLQQRWIKRCTIGGATVAMLAVAFTGLATAQDGQDPAGSGAVDPQTLRVFTGFSHFFKRVLTEDTAVVLNPGAIDPGGFSAYQNLPGAGPGTGAIGVVVAQGSLINVTFTAESLCTGGGTDFNWCGMRILVNGIEAQPAPADFAYDSADNGAEGAGSWESHAFERHICIRNTTGGTITVPVQVQWRVFAGTDGVAPTFRLDDWTLNIQSAVATCQ